MKNPKVLSLFDGIAGAAVALQRLGVTPSCYYASEVNPHAIRIAQRNFPKILELGDINKLNIAGEYFDLVVFGSPCTDLSIGRKNRESLAGKSSSLFYRAVEILQEVQPKYFLMENVASMSQASQKEISHILGVEPILINSVNFTGQNRQRLYWCNWKVTETLPQPPERWHRNVLLPIDQAFHPTLQLSQKAIDYMNRQVSGGRNHWDFGHHSDTNNKASSCVIANFKKGVPYNVLLDCRAKALMIRKFHPTECELLQGFPPNYTKGIPDTHRYDVLGNSFTVDVMEYL